VRLFIERAAAASGEFDLTVDNQAAVVELCRRLDGLPLAIELAAVRTRALSVAQILERLSDRFALLTGGTRAALPRHQTLRTTIDWSHDLLNPAERAVFRRLCVFAGRFTLADVEAVATSTDLPAGRILDLLSGLVDRSLVGKEESKEVACYRLHETIREYARLKLRDAGEEEAVEDRLAEHYRGIGLRAMPDARFHLVERLSWLELEIDNIRAVLRRCVERADFTRGIDITQGAAWYWITHATTEGLRWLEELLPHGRGSPQAAGWAYFLRGFLSLLKADAAKARTGLLEAASYARDAGQPALLSQALAMVAVTEMMTWDLQAARRVLEEAHAVGTDLDDVAVKVGLFQARSLVGLASRDLDEVRAASSTGVQLSRAANDLYALEMLLTNLGLAAFLSGDLIQAKPRFTEAMGVTRQLDDRVALYYQLTMLGCHAASCGQHRRAAQLIGAAESSRTSAGANPLPFLPPLVAQAERTAIATLGKATFQAEVERGRRLTRQAAIALALEERTQASDAMAASDQKRYGLLGKREAQVARLVAEGFSNKQIGAKLFISERTVDSHVRSILNKLGVNSRAQIARWIEAQGS
jgi:DNA-binding CsgD family transcriptional regulator